MKENNLPPCSALSTRSANKAPRVLSTKSTPRRLPPPCGGSLVLSGGNCFALFEIRQLRGECCREGRPRLAARLVGNNVGMMFEQVLAVEAAQHRRHHQVAGGECIAIEIRL